MLVDTFVVDSPNVRYDDEHITAAYECAHNPANPAVTLRCHSPAPAAPSAAAAHRTTPHLRHKQAATLVAPLA